MNRSYWGCELRLEQVAANKSQMDKIETEKCPEWVSGDSEHMLMDAPRADLVFSRPPYGNLEKYSNDGRDLSNMTYRNFYEKYRRIIKTCCHKMNRDSFACFVVSNYRNKSGSYNDLVGLTVSCFEEFGAVLYNEAILCTPLGSAAVRVSKQFQTSRKMAKVHQNVLVFCKGNPRNLSHD